MMHGARSSIEEVSYCFSRSYVKLQGHTALKIIDFDPNWVFPDCNSSLESPMATKWCTKLEVALKRCPIVFQGHLSNFKVTWDKISPILTQIGRFRTISRSQLSNPQICLVGGHPIKFQGHTGLKNWRFESSLSKITRPVAAIKSLRFALFIMNLKFVHQVHKWRFWCNF